MIAYRQRGFVNFYTIFVGLFAIALFSGFVVALPWLPLIDLLPNLNLAPYGLAVVIGVLASSRLFRQYAHKLHALHGSEALSLAFQQTAYIGACIFALMFATKDRQISRLFLGSYLMLLGSCLTIMHGRLPRFFARLLFADLNKARTLFVGKNTTPESLVPWVAEREHLGILPIGYLAEEVKNRGEILEVPRLGNTDKLAQILGEQHINQVILLDWIDDPMAMERLVEVCETEGCRLLIHNSFASKFARNLVSVEEGGQHFFAVQEEPLEDPLSRALKRVLDIVVSLPVVMLVLPPLFLLVWLVQRFQAPGPILFTAARGGQQRREFRMFKFRSMYMDNPDVAKQATAGDSRIYPFGRFLRRSSLDEFPQFFNVLIGHMSIVGPRPHLPQHDVEFSRIEHTYRVRGLVKPGLTGLAQIRGYRGEITDPELLRRRVYWDLYYVTNWTIWMDIRIIMRTVLVVFSPPKTAY